jgi:hypothetical protein
MAVGSSIHEKKCSASSTGAPALIGAARLAVKRHAGSKLRLCFQRAQPAPRNVAQVITKSSGHLMPAIGEGINARTQKQSNHKCSRMDTDAIEQKERRKCFGAILVLALWRIGA